MLPDREFKTYTDNELRSEALSRRMKPVPNTIKGLLSVVDTKENPMTTRKIQLGKELFFDPILSRDMTINCASCHLLNNGGDDNKPTAIGF
jgi:cytochrome c peroxidase